MSASGPMMDILTLSSDEPVTLYDTNVPKTDNLAGGFDAFTIIIYPSPVIRPIRQPSPLRVNSAGFVHHPGNDAIPAIHSAPRPAANWYGHLQRIHAYYYAISLVAAVPQNLRDIFSNRFMRVHYRFFVLEQYELEFELRKEAERDAISAEHVNRQSMWSEKLDLGSDAQQSQVFEALKAYETLELVMKSFAPDKRRRMEARHYEDASGLEAENGGWIDIGNEVNCLKAIDYESDIPKYGVDHPALTEAERIQRRHFREELLRTRLEQGEDAERMVKHDREAKQKWMKDQERFMAKDHMSMKKTNEAAKNIELEHMKAQWRETLGYETPEEANGGRNRLLGFLWQ
ncbi:hypothetical protein B0J11DRAFT_583084 [Dendryphion nanum]|uniref:Uncharacterized protein n=1 Tax=Dendryphion nanum TaxID=256645 RepID=A0A9P9DEX0_9PLEO|nr:hypothetical protein B0J11DRAFT_583084 [Dendryphion nanum]